MVVRSGPPSQDVDPSIKTGTQDGRHTTLRRPRPRRRPRDLESQPCCGRNGTVPVDLQYRPPLPSSLPAGVPRVRIRHVEKGRHRVDTIQTPTK